jgi:hypothetical protein
MQAEPDEIPKCHRCKEVGVILAMARSHLWDFAKAVCQNCFIRHCHNTGIFPIWDDDGNVVISNINGWRSVSTGSAPKDPLSFNKTFDSRDINRMKVKCDLAGFDSCEFDRMYNGTYPQRQELRDIVKETSRAFKRKGIDDYDFLHTWLADYDAFNDKTRRIGDLDLYL